jgi:hypothetical protein
MIRFLAVLAGLISIFIFPWQVTLAAMLAASFLVPPAGFALGIICDLVYYQPGAALFPYISLYGAFCTLAALLVHRFVKTRIISG